MVSLLKRWSRNPSLQFVAVLLLAPIIAIAGEAFGGPKWFKAFAIVACTLIAFAARRSFHHERAIRGGVRISDRHIIMAGTVAVVSAAAAILLTGWLAVDLFG